MSDNDVTQILVLLYPLLHVTFSSQICNPPLENDVTTLFKKFFFLISYSKLWYLSVSAFFAQLNETKVQHIQKIHKFILENFRDVTNFVTPHPVRHVCHKFLRPPPPISSVTSLSDSPTLYDIHTKFVFIKNYFQNFKLFL